MSFETSCGNILFRCKKIMHSLNSIQESDTVDNNESKDSTYESVAPRKLIDAFSLLWSQGLIELDTDTESNVAKLCREMHMATHERDVNTLLDFIDDMHKFEIPGFKWLRTYGKETLLFKIDIHGDYDGRYRHHLFFICYSDSVTIRVISSKAHEEDYTGISTTIENITSIKMLQGIFKFVFFDETNIGKNIPLPSDAHMHVEKLPTHTPEERQKMFSEFIDMIDQGYLRTGEIAKLIDDNFMKYVGEFEDRSTASKILYRYDDIKISMARECSDNNPLTIATCVRYGRIPLQRTVTFRDIYSMGRLLHIFFFHTLWSVTWNQDEYEGSDYDNDERERPDDEGLLGDDASSSEPVLRDFDEADRLEYTLTPVVHNPYDALFTMF